MKSSSVIPLFGPSGSDWITTVRTRDGRVINRRICPGTIAEEDAVRLSVHASDLSPSDIADVSVRRASDARILTERVDDEFKALMGRVQSMLDNERTDR